VVGRVNWNKTLVDGHYEITNPTRVTCQGPAPETAREPSQQKTVAAVAAPPVVGAELARPPNPPQGTRTWVGRYEDSRGAGEVTLTLLRGESTVSGSWKLRTGGGGPVTGLVEGGGRRLQLRMENIAPECPGLFDAVAEVADTALTATYRGNDCQGAVTSGRLDLHVQ
jgi:hypothetical protein